MTEPVIKTIPPEDSPKRYQVKDAIGSGGMGEILLAEDRKLKRSVALKVLKDTYSGSHEYIKRFVQEAQLTGNLEHPNIIPIHDMGVNSDGTVFYSMKVVDGITLRDVLNGLRRQNPATRKSFDLNYLLDIFLKVCDAVAFAHSKGILHRDIKPENIMIGEFGEVIVLDWGLAKKMDVDDTVDTAEIFNNDGPDSAFKKKWAHITSGKVKGTPGYMAPEQIRRGADEVDERSDIFSLGVILYMILTLRKPISGSNVDDVLMKTLLGDITSPADRDETELSRDHLPLGEMPLALSAVAMRALARFPDERYQSVKDLQQEVERYQQGHVTQAENAGIFRHVLLLIKRHKYETSLFSLSLCILTVSAVFFTVHLNEQHSRETYFAKQAESDSQKEAAQLDVKRTNLNEIQRTGPIFFRQALIRMDQLRLAEASLLINNALILQKKNPLFNYKKGNILLLSGSLEEAKEYYQEAISISPENIYTECINFISKIEPNSTSHDGRLLRIEKLMERLGESREQLVAQKLIKARWKLLEPQLRERLKNEGLDNILNIDNGVANLVIVTRIDTISSCEGFPLSSLNFIGKEDAEINLKPLHKMPLRSLNIERTRIQAEHILKYLPLENLVLLKCKIESLKSLPDSLQILDLTGTVVTGSKSLRHLNNLRTLSLYRSPASDLSNLHLPNIESLDLSYSSITRIAPLAGSSLHELNLTGCNIADIGNLQNIKTLHHFVYWYSRLEMLDCIKGLSLEHLDLAESNALYDISAVSGMPVRYLNINHTSVKDISPLAGSPLRKLYMIGCPCNDITPLRTLPLEVLAISDRHVSGMQAIVSEMPLLKRIIVDAKGVRTEFTYDEFRRHLNR